MDRRSHNFHIIYVLILAFFAVLIHLRDLLALANRRCGAGDPIVTNSSSFRPLVATSADGR